MNFVIWADKLANEEYLALYYQNYYRRKLYGVTKSETDQKLNYIFRNLPDNVSEIPYASRNSPQYFKECPNATKLIGDFSICEKVVREFVSSAEECASTQYYMSFCQLKNGFTPDEFDNFKAIQKRAYAAGVSKIPFETIRSKEFQSQITFLLSPIAENC